MLADGGTVHVRPIRPDDAERLVAFHARLSPESIYFRFFSPKPRLTDKEIERFTTVDFDDRVALVALLGDDIIGGGPLRPLAAARRGRGGVHRRRRAPRPRHGHGAARAPRRHRPRASGITRFTAEVLPDNRPMLGVFRAAGFEVSTRFSAGIIDVAFDIDPDRAVPRVGRAARAARREPLDRPAAASPGRSP